MHEQKLGKTNKRKICTNQSELSGTTICRLSNSSRTLAGNFPVTFIAYIPRTTVSIKEYIHKTAHFFVASLLPSYVSYLKY